MKSFDYFNFDNKDLKATTVLEPLSKSCHFIPRDNEDFFIR